ncbi:MAG: LarC family nickel insertion protein [Coriobacteriia bacterium]|nr:LarC family nickel insertion protein [Coriobacteriia bacterium]
MSKEQQERTMWLDCSQGVTSAKLFDAIERHFPDTLSWCEVQRFMTSVRAREQASAVFEVLANAEAEAHGVSRDEMHFHEVGRLSNLTRVIGIFAALEMLGINEWYASPPVIGNGTVTCSHGDLSVPTPATKRIIGAHDIPITAVEEEPIVGELTTPTGVALLTQASGFLSEPPGSALRFSTRNLPQ